MPNKQPLPNRVNIIITDDNDFSVNESNNVYIVHGIFEAVELCEAFFSDKEIFVIGGATIYNQFIGLDLIDEAYVTRVNDNSIEDNDVVINAFWDDENKWKVYYESYSQRQRTDGNDITYKFLIYKHI